MSQPPPGWKVPKPKPPWGYRKTPPPSGPSPDYTAPAEEHRKELISQKDVVKPLVIKPHEEVSFAPPVIYDPLVDVDGVPTTYTITEEERERSRKAITETLKAEEAFFGLFEKPLLEKSKELEEKSLELAKKGKQWEGFASYIGGIGTYSAAQFIGGATLIVRPLLIKETGETVYSLIADPKARKEFVSEVARDPFKFIAGTGAGVAGGYTTGKLISRAKARITRAEATKIPSESFLIDEPETRLAQYPSAVTDTVTDYILEKTKISKSGVESPATLIERGKWPKGWGGTPVLLTEDPGFVEIMKPIPFTEILEGHLPGTPTTKVPIVVKPSVLPPTIMGIAGGLTGISTIDKDLVGKVSDALLYDKPDFPGSQITPQIVRTVTTTRQRERTEQIIDPVLSSRAGFLPIQEPITRQRQRGRTRTVEKEVAKDVQELALSLRKFDIDMRKSTFELDRPLVRGKPRKRSKVGYEEIWGETRRYHVAERKKFFKKLLGGLI